jgi:hypothetical protein
MITSLLYETGWECIGRRRYGSYLLSLDGLGQVYMLFSKTRT